jgi:hypothetical protein
MDREERYIDRLVSYYSSLYPTTMRDLNDDFIKKELVRKNRDEVVDGLLGDNE